jgi:hypothetical protein
MKRTPIVLVALWTFALTPALADPSSPPIPSAAPAGPSSGGGHSYDPCAMVSQQDVAAAAGVAADQVFKPASPTKGECIWAVANKVGTPGQQVALTVQTIDQVKQAHGIAKFGALLSAVQSIPGVPMPANPIVTRAFADAQIVVGLGDRASWKNGTLSVVKSELLLQVSVAGQPTGTQSLDVAKAVAKAALQNMPTQ